MADTTLLAAAKLALRLTTNAFDTEISDLLDAAYLDMGVAGITVPQTADALVKTAAITYVRAHFGSPTDYDKLKKSYDEQKAQMQTTSTYGGLGAT